MSTTGQDPRWLRLKRYTTARIALGRASNSLPTQALLAFELAHARARDAVHASLDAGCIARSLEALGLSHVEVQSQAATRTQYLLRPDLGRRLNESSREKLERERELEAPELVIVIADGLSATATQNHAIPMLASLQASLKDWRLGPIIIAEQARVGLGDEIGQLLSASFTVLLIGERPGLSAPDSLGIYLTYGPHLGRSDAERNCISNIRSEGLSYELAAHRLMHLLSRSRRLGLSGVALKDESDAPEPRQLV